MNKLREQFEKECGWYPSEVDDRMDWRYIDEYREWLEQRIKANHHETFVILQRDEKAIDSAAANYAKDKPKWYQSETGYYSINGAFKDGAIWMLDWLKKNAK